MGGREGGGEEGGDAAGMRGGGRSFAQLGKLVGSEHCLSAIILTVLFMNPWLKMALCYFKPALL